MRRECLENESILRERQSACKQYEGRLNKISFRTENVRDVYKCEVPVRMCTIRSIHTSRNKMKVSGKLRMRSSRDDNTPKQYGSRFGERNGTLE